VEKYCGAGQATENNKANAPYVLDDSSYKYTLRLCKTHCFSTAMMVAERGHFYVIGTLLVFALAYH